MDLGKTKRKEATHEKDTSKSGKIRKELRELLDGRNNEASMLLSEIIRKGSSLIIQEFLEQEVTEFLGTHYQRSKGEHIGYHFCL